MRFEIALQNALGACPIAERGVGSGQARCGPEVRAHSRGAPVDFEGGAVLSLGGHELAFKLVAGERSGVHAFLSEPE